MDESWLRTNDSERYGGIAPPPSRRTIEYTRLDPIPKPGRFAKPSRKSGCLVWSRTEPKVRLSCLEPNRAGTESQAVLFGAESQAVLDFVLDFVESQAVLDFVLDFVTSARRRSFSRIEDVTTSTDRAALSRHCDALVLGSNARILGEACEVENSHGQNVTT